MQNVVEMQKIENESNQKNDCVRKILQFKDNRKVLLLWSAPYSPFRSRSPKGERGARLY